MLPSRGEWTSVFCSLTETRLCPPRQNPVSTAAFCQMLHLAHRHSILAERRLVPVGIWAHVFCAAEPRSALPHVYLSGQECHLLMPSFFKSSWQLMSSVPRNGLDSVTHSPFLTFAHWLFQPSASTSFQTHLCQGWRLFSPSITFTSFLPLSCSLATGVISKTVERKQHFKVIFFL